MRQRAAPRLTVNGTRRLSAEFVALMTGRAGWVAKTDGLSRVAQLHLLGNAAVPWQATHAHGLLPFDDSPFPCIAQVGDVW
ncbi:hypothetical protein [Streptomyces sp. MUSC 14]|uniref:hypothetical protein n=1 Tax=Streptomyces sp. MUSC 14 TaxID=1354889 RepID=UPI000D1AF997|nr:hypothetical protein [Streptomyces sp. MUSC 14]